jgi:2-polyprenyl-3-methyl-5-hydroxy-6-metoxy-1,4-benzoquinol methylase
MQDLSRRSTQAEVMDDETTNPEDYARCLADLETLNRLTLTHRPTLRWLDAATRGIPAGAVVSVLDIASGHGDLLRAIDRWAKRRGLRPRLTGIDLNRRSGVAAAAATPADVEIAWVQGNVFDYEPQPRPDFIVSSQFTHHLDDDQVVAFLRWLEGHAMRGWYVADLHRHAIPYYGFRLLARLAGWHRIVRYDGTVSIARSFRRADWQRLIAAAGVPAEVHWHMAFRLCVGRIKPPAQARR